MVVKVVSIVEHSLNKHENAEFAAKVAESWTTERRDYLLKQLFMIEKAIDEGNHTAYRKSFHFLRLALEAQKETLDKLHEKMLFTEAENDDTNAG